MVPQPLGLKHTAHCGQGWWCLLLLSLSLLSGTHYFQKVPPSLHTLPPFPLARSGVQAVPLLPESVGKGGCGFFSLHSSRQTLLSEAGVVKWLLGRPH